MKHYLIIITSIFFLSCDNNNINDKSKRNENWAWWIDAKTPLSARPGLQATIGLALWRMTQRSMSFCFAIVLHISLTL